MVGSLHYRREQLLLVWTRTAFEYPWLKQCSAILAMSVRVLPMPLIVPPVGFNLQPMDIAFALLFAWHKETMHWTKLFNQLYCLEHLPFLLQDS